MLLAGSVELVRDHREMTGAFPSLRQARERRSARKAEQARQEAEEAKRARKAERKAKAAKSAEKAARKTDLETDPSAQVTCRPVLAPAFAAVLSPS